MCIVSWRLLTAIDVDHCQVVFVTLRVRRRTYDEELVGSTASQVAIVSVRLESMSVCIQPNHLGMQPPTQINSAFHPSGVAKSSTGLPGC